MKNDADYAIANLARQMIAGQLDLLAGCLEMRGLIWNAFNPDDEKYLTFIGIDSELDGYRPPDDPWFSAEYVAQVHADAVAYIERCAPGILAACQRIVEDAS